MDLSDYVFSKDPKVSGHVLTTGVTRVNLYELNQSLNLKSLFGAGIALDYSSDSVSDVDSTGSGAWQVTVYGLDPNWKPMKETINLNGQTKVTGVVLFRRVFAAAVSASGTGGAAAGNIYIVATGSGGVYTAGVPATLTSGVIKIVLGEGEGWSGYWTIPAGRIALLKQLVVSGIAQNARIQVQVQPNLDVDPNYATPLDGLVPSAGIPNDLNLFHDLYQFDAGTDVVLTVIAKTAGAEVSADMSFHCIQQ